MNKTKQYKKYNILQQTTATELHTLNLGQAHAECGIVTPVC